LQCALIRYAHFIHGTNHANVKKLVGRSLLHPITITTSDGTGECGDSNFRIAQLQEEVRHLRIQLALSKAKENPVNLFPELTSQERAENAEIVALTIRAEKAEAKLNTYIALQNWHEIEEEV